MCKSEWAENDCFTTDLVDGAHENWISLRNGHQTGVPMQPVLVEQLHSKPFRFFMGEIDWRLSFSNKTIL